MGTQRVEFGGEHLIRSGETVVVDRTRSMAALDQPDPDGGARGGPERRTQVVELASGDEERNASWADSRRRYDAAYGIRAIARTLITYYDKRKAAEGNGERFLGRFGLGHTFIVAGAALKVEIGPRQWRGQKLPRHGGR